MQRARAQAIDVRRPRLHFRFARCTVAPKSGRDGGLDQCPVWALPVQRLLSDLLADTELGDHVAIAIGIMRLQVVQQAAAFAYEHQQTPA